MANYDNLPVFKACYDLLLHIFKQSRNWSKDVRYTLGEELKKEIIGIQQLIYQANSTHEKKEFIQRARVAVVKVKLQLRIAHDLREMSLKQYASLAEQAESVSKQLAAWEKKSQQEKI